MNESHIIQTHATGDEIAAIVEKIEVVIEGEPIGHLIISLLSMVVTIMYPRCTPEELQDAITGMSQWLVLFLGEKHLEDEAEAAAARRLAN